MPNNLQEFLNENLHRNYPVKDSCSAQDTTGSFNIPTELIADIRLVIPQGFISSGVFFISEILIGRYSASVEISYAPSAGLPAAVGWFHNLDTGADSFASYQFVTVPQTDSNFTGLEDTTGTLVAGSLSSSRAFPGAWKFVSGNTELVPTCVEEQLTKFRALKVDDSIYTGDIVLEEGENITIDTAYDPASDTTVITISSSEIESSEITINNDAQLLAALTAIYGPPIVRINEIPPQQDGNFDLLGADCVVLTGTQSGAQISNPCGEPCCDKETYLSPVYDSINQLNARHARLEDFMKSSVDNLDILIGRLKDMENSIGIGGV